MTFNEFVSGVAAMEPQHTKKETREILSNAIEYIKEQMIAGESITFNGFAHFDSVEVAESHHINPQTRQPMIVPAHLKPRCRFSSRFKNIIKEG